MNQGVCWGKLLTLNPLTASTSELISDKVSILLNSKDYAGGLTKQRHCFKTLINIPGSFNLRIWSGDMFSYQQRAKQDLH